ncbi:MAG: hypothetical protein ABSC94_23220 [Polyangiaceae bacterium]
MNRLDVRYFSASRREWTFAAFVVLAYVAVATWATVTHEMWRDELHCWLVARDSQSPWQVIRERAYDGQPPLWYLLLWVLTRFTWRPELMRVVHLSIAASVVAVFARYAPWPRPARVLFSFGYFVAYEYAALSRCYGLALLFALLLCVGHARRHERPFTTGILLAALGLTTTVATLLAAAYALAMAIDWLADRSLSRPPWRVVAIPFGLAAAGGFAAALCAWPPEDSTVAHIGVAPQMPWDFAWTRIVAALVPIPPADFFFWNSNALLDFLPGEGARFALASAIFAWAIVVVSSDRFASLLFGLATVLLVALFKCVYSGSVRHHGFIFVAFLMATWIAREACAGDRPAAGWRAVRGAALLPTVALGLAVQVPGAAIAIAYDTRYVFSSGKRAADELRSRGLQRALLVAEFDYPATAMLGQLGPDALAYSPRTGRPFTFVKWTRDRLWEPTDEQAIDFAVRLGVARGENPVLVMNRPLRPALIDGERVVPLAEKYDSMIEEENFYLYRIKCGR